MKTTLNLSARDTDQRTALNLSSADTDQTFAVGITPAKAKAAKHADGKNKTAEVLGTDPNQADDVSREDGATEYDPIAHQRAAMQSWSAKPAAKGSA